jgi:hypothetical protein
MSLILDGTNGLSDVDGSAATPAIRGSDANTGVFFGTDIVGVSTGGSERVRVDASGNVGIGTSSPSGKLQVNTNTNNRIVFADAAHDTLTNLTSAITFSRTDGSQNLGAVFGWNNGGLAVAGREGLVFATGGGNTYSNTPERMRIDSSGNLLVGTTSVIAGTENTNQGTSLSNSGLLALARASTQSNITFAKVGAVGSGQYTNFAYNGATIGSIGHTATTTSYNTSSDYRLKHDIQPMTGALAKVAQLKPVTYKWNADDSESQGFIAHELQEVVPECVTGEKDAVDAEGNPQYQGIDTSFLVATLVSAIQEQQAIITALTARVEALEGAQG